MGVGSVNLRSSSARRRLGCNPSCSKVEMNLQSFECAQFNRSQVERWRGGDASVLHKSAPSSTSAPEESQIERHEQHDNADIHDKSFPESVPEEREVQTDDNE